MTDVKRMADLTPGQQATVEHIGIFREMRRRLQDMGLIEGTRVECIGRSPLGDPTAFLVRGAVIALRREDAGRIGVRLKED